LSITKVLLVDDNQDILEILEAELSERLDEVEFKSALDGASAFELIGSGYTPDMILTDYNMPKVNGSDFAKRVHCEFPGIGIFLISGHTELLSQLDSTIVSFYKVVDKPIDYDQLSFDIKSFLNKKITRVEDYICFNLENLKGRKVFPFEVFLQNKEGGLESLFKQNSKIDEGFNKLVVGAESPPGYIRKECFKSLDQTDFLPVRVSTIRENQEVDFTVFHQNPNGDFSILISKGSIIKSGHINILKSNNIRKVFIRSFEELYYQEYLDKILEEVIKCETVSSEEKAIVVEQYTSDKVKKVFDNISSEEIGGLKVVGKTMRKFISEEGTDGVFNILSLQNGAGLQSHASNVAFLSVTIYEEVIRMRTDKKRSHLSKPFDNILFDNDETKDELILGSLLHDIGEVPGICGQFDFLDDDMHHCVLGAILLREMKVSPGVVQCVADHQERCDGTGEPRGIFKGKLSILTQILSLADYIENQVSNENKPLRDVIDSLDSVEPQFNKFLIPIVRETFAS